jgi:protein HIRA/HIR1
VVSSYDPALSAWVKLSERWWSEGSDAWQGRRANTQSAGRGILSAVEGSIGGTPDEAIADRQRPKWWHTALTLGHLETRLSSTRLLDSPQEYKQAMSMYAKRIADEGFRAKAEELIKELFGPVYWYVCDGGVLFCHPLADILYVSRPGREDVWSPTVVGLSKRDLLKDVLSIFGQSVYRSLYCGISFGPLQRGVKL